MQDYVVLLPALYVAGAAAGAWMFPMIVDLPLGSAAVPLTLGLSLTNRCPALALAGKGVPAATRPASTACTAQVGRWLMTHSILDRGR